MYRARGDQCPPTPSPPTPKYQISLYTFKAQLEVDFDFSAPRETTSKAAGITKPNGARVVLLFTLRVIMRCATDRLQPHGIPAYAAKDFWINVPNIYLGSRSFCRLRIYRGT